MATDATGSPTSLGIPKYNTSADAPSGLGFNAAMDSIDALLAARVTKPAGIVSGEVPSWNGTTWVRSSVTNIGPSSLGSGTPDATKFLRGDGAWQVPSAGAATYAGAMAHAGSSLSVPTSTPTLVVLDTFDRNVTGYTFSSGKVVVPTSGKYRVTAQVAWPSSASGTRELQLIHYTSGGVSNGFFAITDGPGLALSNHSVQVSGTESLTVGEMIGVIVTQTSGGSLTAPGGAASIYGWQQIFIEYLGT